MLYSLLHYIHLLNICLLFNVLHNVMVCKLQSHLEDQHGNEASFNISTRNMGPLRNQESWPCRNMNESHCRIKPPKLLINMVLVKDKAYNIGKVGKDEIDSFLVHYYLNGYYHTATITHIYLANIGMGRCVLQAKKHMSC